MPYSSCSAIRNARPSIPRPDVGGKSVRRRIGGADDLGFVGEPDDRRDRPEGFLLENAHSLLDAKEQRRLEEQPVFLVAADHGVRALADGIVDVRGDLREALLVDERAHLRLIAHGIADAKLAHTIGHPIREAAWILSCT
jgi:hypothetical protein